MKKYTLLFLCLSAFRFLFAQSPQSFQYQSVVRDAAGTALVNQPVNFQISIISGSITGTVVYSETHTASTNAYGIVTLNVGGGTPVTGTFSAINWGSASHYIKVEADPTGGTSYLDMGTTQLLSVPYSLYSEQAGNVPTYSGGTGIDVTGTTITNTSPDQTVTITQGGATSVTGTYPNFTISSTDNNTTYTAGTGIDVTGTTITNTSPDQPVTLTQGGATTVTGTYPNFTISSTDNNTTYTAGTGINVTGTTITNTAPDQTVSLTQGGATTITGAYPNFTISSTDLNTGTPGGLNKTLQFNNAGVFAGDTALVWDNTNKRLGIGTSTPLGRVVIKGSSTAPANEPLFEVKNSLGQQIMAIYNDSVHFFITDIGSNRGGFAVSGRNNAKALTNDYLRINADSTRIWTSDTLKGFGVRNIGVTSKTSYMQLTPSNYFIGHESGESINVAGGGIYNCYYGYQAGKYTTVGNRNNAIGYQSLFSNTNGTYNVSNGFQALYSNVGGSYNVANGYQALYSNTNNSNVANGYQALYFNTSGDDNTAEGYQALYKNTTGRTNVAIGSNALWSNTTYNANVAIGDQSMYYAIGGSNTAVGQWSLFYNTGSNNTALGFGAFFSWTPTSYTNSTAIGCQAQITASNQVKLGDPNISSFYCMGAYVGAVGVTNRDLYVDNTGKIGFLSSSERYKNNITDMENINWLYELRPVNYTYKNDSTNRKQYGLIAEEVEKSNPLFVSYNPDGTVETVNYSNFISPMLKALQEQKSEINELKALLKLKDNNFESLKAEIDQLKSLLNSAEKK